MKYSMPSLCSIPEHPYTPMVLYMLAQSANKGGGLQVKVTLKTIEMNKSSIYSRIPKQLP